MRELIIDGRVINDSNDAYVISEIGHNHQGSLEKCKELIRKAKECGADAVKLQKRANRDLYTKTFYGLPYDNPNSFGKTYGEHREALELGEDEYVEIKKFCSEIGIVFFATPFDLVSVDFLDSLGIAAFKIASGDLTNIPLIEYIAQFNKPMIISTGGSCMKDIVRAYNAVGHKKLAFLHCVASYPNQPEDMNLKAIQTLRDAFPTTIVGLSDHYNGILMSEAGYMMGARIIEKHFTLNHSSKGTDHSLSLEPEGLRKLCRDLKRLPVAMGDGLKRVSQKELGPITKMSKAIYPKKRLPKGKKLTSDDLVLKSPGEGLEPYHLDDVIGKITISDLSTGEGLEWEDLK